MIYSVATNALDSATSNLSYHWIWRNHNSELPSKRWASWTRWLWCILPQVQARCVLSCRPTPSAFGSWFLLKHLLLIPRREVLWGRQRNDLSWHLLSWMKESFLWIEPEFFSWSYFCSSVTGFLHCDLGEGGCELCCFLSLPCLIGCTSELSSTTAQEQLVEMSVNLQRSN